MNVQHLRQILLWPLRLMPQHDNALPSQAHQAWRKLTDPGPGTTSAWREHADEYNGGAGGFHERHYNEFVTFLPYVQRFLYGEGRGSTAAGGRGSPMRVFRRRDIAAVRLQPRPGDAPVTLQVVHIDLYFFEGADTVLLNVEVSAENLPLPLAQEVMYRFGRAYPAGWDDAGQALHCMANVEWLGPAGEVLARSDAQNRDAFMAHVAEHRAPRIAAHWEFLLAPMVNHHSDQPGGLRFRLIEYYRMPLMAYLAVDDPVALSPQDFLRLGRVTSGSDTVQLESAASLAEFERQVCYDHFWCAGGAAPHTRYMCTGLALIAVGSARADFFRCGDRGVLAQFRHQHFLLFLIAHFQKATLLMVSDQLAEALTAMDIRQPESIKRFKRRIRLAYIDFLGFTHRYWFQEVSEQAHVKALFHMCTRHLKTEAVYEEVKERIRDMNTYLDADSLRRQANTVVRLTVVTILGLVGTMTTGFLGMNLLAEAEAPMSTRIMVFLVVLLVTGALTVYTITKSKRLSDFLDAVSDERLPALAKLQALAQVWRKDG